MKTLIYCIPLYLFALISLFLLIKSFMPVLVALIKMIPKRVYIIALRGYLVLSVIYIIIVSFI